LTAGFSALCHLTNVKLYYGVAKLCNIQPNRLILVMCPTGHVRIE